MLNNDPIGVDPGTDRRPEYHSVPLAQVLDSLESSQESGLSDDEAATRLAEDGPNEIAEHSEKGLWRTVWEQLTAVLVLLLLAAAAISIVLGDYKDAVAILAIVILNTAIGTRQELRAEHAIAALRRLAVPMVQTKRSGRIREVSAREIVRGDIVLLTAGAAVPADLRLIESTNLQVDESSLTGESETVEKDATLVLNTDVALADRQNMA